MTAIHNILIFLTITLLASATASAEIHAHQHQPGVSPSTLQLNAGKPWPTDAPLRQGMQNIRSAMAAAVPALHKNQLSADQYDHLAQKISSEIGAIVAHCKLDAQADAQLHLIIADLLGGMKTMQGKTKNTKRQSGALQVLDALEKYPAYFDHPGWQPVKH
jgi:hypothetical protein